MSELLLLVGIEQPVKGLFAAVLQKHEEDHQERSPAVLLLRLDGHSEQFCDERSLVQAVSSVHSLHLSFPDHVHHLISL